MSDRKDQDACEFCAHGLVTQTDQELEFQQWTTRGRVFCKVRIPLRSCNKCGAKSWDDAAEANIELAVRQEYEKLPWVT